MTHRHGRTLLLAMEQAGQRGGGGLGERGGADGHVIIGEALGPCSLTTARQGRSTNDTSVLLTRPRVFLESGWGCKAAYSRTWRSV